MALNRRQIGRIAHSLAATLILLAPNLAGGRDTILTINGQNLHVETSGASGPTVVFEAGLGNDATTWKFIAGPVATFARVVLYDRAGLGQSLPMTKKDSAVTADEVATNLRALLAAADVRPPYILVGHSLGGLYVQMFARKYPKEVSGIVLLELVKRRCAERFEDTRAPRAGDGGLSGGRGHSRKQQADHERQPLSGYSAYGDRCDGSRTIFQSLGAHADAVAAATCDPFPSSHSYCGAG